MRQLTDNTLRIEKVKREDAGTYVCQAQIRGRPIYQHLSVSVVVNGEQLSQIKTLLMKLLSFIVLRIVNSPPPVNFYHQDSRWRFDFSRILFNTVLSPFSKQQKDKSI